MDNIYKIAEKYESILCGYLTELEKSEIEKHEITLESLIDGVAGEFNEKVINLSSIIKNLEVNIDSLSNAIDNFKNRMEIITKKRDKIANMVKNSMLAVGVSRVECNFFDIKISKNPPKVVILDQEKIPEKYIKRRLIDELDKKQLKEDLKNGLILGCAKLESSERLIIK